MPESLPQKPPKSPEKRIQELEAQAAQLKRKYAKEVQPSKRNIAFKAYKQAKAELSLLKGE